MAINESSLFEKTWHVVVGRPLKATQAAKEEINPVEGLSALSLDALTSVAYGPQAIVLVLVVAGTTALHLVFPITIAIVALLALLVLSYRQVIEAYPQGGGAYAVSKDNFGTHASLVAGASLIIDYTLTVAVSIAAGVAGLVSAFPSLASQTVPLCIAILLVITWLNLRGLGDGARAFLLPTLVFILGLLGIILVGLIHPLAPHIHQLGRLVATRTTATNPTTAIGVLLILKAFSSGCSALTGVEAIANGVPLFRHPRVKRAKQTEMLLGLILGTMLLGLARLAVNFGIQPRSGQTVLSQIMSASVGRHWAYFIVDISITVVLGLAANTSFGGLPVLASLLAKDNFLPHSFAIRGDRQVFNTGVWVLAVLSGVLLIVVGGNVNALIPMYAIGVFIGFTLAQSGLVVHWYRMDPSTRPKRWQPRALLSTLGAVTTGTATVIFLLSKFAEGGWVVVVVIPSFIWLFYRIKTYYNKVAQELELIQQPPASKHLARKESLAPTSFSTLGVPIATESIAIPSKKRLLVIVLVNKVSKLTSEALSYALSMVADKNDVVGLYVEFVGDETAAENLRKSWQEWNLGVRLVCVKSQYHSVVRPVLRFVHSAEVLSHEKIMVLIPVVVPRHWWHRVLQNQIDVVLSSALRRHSDVAVGRVTLRLAEDK